MTTSFDVFVQPGNGSPEYHDKIEANGYNEAKEIARRRNPGCWIGGVVVDNPPRNISLDYSKSSSSSYSGGGGSDDWFWALVGGTLVGGSVAAFKLTKWATPKLWKATKWTTLKAIWVLENTR